MFDQQQEYKGFSTNKPVHSLSPVEALAFLNRWAKLRNYFYYEDINILYEIKEEKIAEWLKSAEVISTAIIVRESEAFVGMRRELENGGKNLDWLNWKSYNSYLTETESNYFSLLCELSEQSENFGISVDYPSEIYQNWLKQLESEFEAYQKAKKEYEKEFKRRQPILKDYNQSLQKYNQRKEIAAREWANINNIRIARSRSGKNLKKDWSKRLEKQGFAFESPPKYPFSEDLKPPKAIKKPPKSYIINFSNYLPGSILEVESVLNWAKSFCQLPEHYCDIDEDFICFSLEELLSQTILERIKKEVLQIFEKVLDRSLSNPKKIWEELTKFEIEYSEALGMNSYTNFRYHETYHRDFGNWHEINLSLTGYWLIEFQSTMNPNITFHVPFNHYHKSPITLSLDKLPRINSDQSKFGREINNQEKKQYPIEELLKILGLSLEDFPFKLQKYEKQSFYHNDDDWDDWDQEDFY